MRVSEAYELLLLGAINVSSMSARSCGLRKSAYTAYAVGAAIFQQLPQIDMEAPY